MPRMPVLARCSLVALGAVALASCHKTVPSRDDAGAPASIAVRVPAGVRIARELDAITVSFDGGALATITVPLAEGMTAGIEVDTSLSPIGDPRHQDKRMITRLPAADVGTTTWGAKEGVPEPGKRYAVEMTVTVFETDAPARGGTWPPRDGRLHVLWTRTLRQTEE
jgi:hypothetical protein